MIKKEKSNQMKSNLQEVNRQYISRYNLKTIGDATKIQQKKNPIFVQFKSIYVFMSLVTPGILYVYIYKYVGRNLQNKPNSESRLAPDIGRCSRRNKPPECLPQLLFSSFLQCLPSFAFLQSKTITTKHKNTLIRNMTQNS